MTELFDSLPVGARVWVAGHDVRTRGLVNDRLRGCLRPPMGEIDLAVVTPLTVDEWRYFAEKSLGRLRVSDGPVLVVPQMDDVGVGVDIGLFELAVADIGLQVRGCGEFGGSHWVVMFGRGCS